MREDRNMNYKNKTSSVQGLHVLGSSKKIDHNGVGTHYQLTIVTSQIVFLNSVAITSKSLASVNES